MDIAGPPDIFKNENVRANENLGEVRRRLINKISSYQGKPQWSPGYIKKVLTGCEKQALNNAAKSKILYPWTGYLGYILTRDGLNHNLLRLRLTRNTSSHYVDKLNRFLRMVYTQRHVNEMKWNACTSYRFNWECGQTKVMLKGHKKLLGFGMQSPTSIWLSKTIIARDVVLVYPNYSTKFEIYADASESQLGSIITQNRLLAFFGRKKVVGY